MSLYIFSFLAIVSIVTSLLMVLSKNPVRSVLYLIATLFAITGEYILLNAQFLAVVHIIVYAGAIMVLFLFVLMLLNLNKDTEPQKSTLWKVTGVITSGLLLVTIVGALKMSDKVVLPLEHDSEVGLVGKLGKVLFTDFVVPFEIAGILFLAAMIGAVLVGKRSIED